MYGPGLQRAYARKCLQVHPGGSTSTVMKVNIARHEGEVLKEWRSTQGACGRRASVRQTQKQRLSLVISDLDVVTKHRLQGASGCRQDFQMDSGLDSKFRVKRR
jgi:hypothetical protein